MLSQRRPLAVQISRHAICYVPISLQQRCQINISAVGIITSWIQKKIYTCFMRLVEPMEASMKKSTKCTAILKSLVLLSAGVNAIFVGCVGSRATQRDSEVGRQ